MEKIPKNTETANILIGQVGFLKQPIMGIFRLRTPNVVEGLSEISLPTRFLVLIIGPFRGISIAEHCELGRALAALFNDKVFVYLYLLQLMHIYYLFIYATVYVLFIHFRYCIFIIVVVIIIVFHTNLCNT